MGADGEMIGVVSLREALQKASEAGLDLVEVAPQAEPPVCKILDLGKYLYEEQKKKKEAKKKQRVVHTKEIKFRFNTDSHDLEYRIRNAREFLQDGDKVKFSVKFKGREIAHSDLTAQRLKDIIEQLKDISKVEIHPRIEAGQYIMQLAPTHVK